MFVSLITYSPLSLRARRRRRRRSRRTDSRRLLLRQIPNTSRPQLFIRNVQAFRPLLRRGHTVRPHRPVLCRTTVAIDHTGRSHGDDVRTTEWSHRKRVVAAVRTVRSHGDRAVVGVVVHCSVHAVWEGDFVVGDSDVADWVVLVRSGSFWTSEEDHGGRFWGVKLLGKYFQSPVGTIVLFQ